MGFLSKTYNRYRTGEIRLEEDISDNYKMSISLINDFINRYTTDHFGSDTRCSFKFYKHKNYSLGFKPTTPYRTEAVFHNVLGHDISITNLYPGDTTENLYSWTAWLMKCKSETTHDKRFIDIHDQMRNNLYRYEKSKDEDELLKTTFNPINPIFNPITIS